MAQDYREHLRTGKRIREGCEKAAARRKLMAKYEAQCCACASHLRYAVQYPADRARQLYMAEVLAWKALEHKTAAAQV